MCKNGDLKKLVKLWQNWEIEILIICCFKISITCGDTRKKLNSGNKFLFFFVHLFDEIIENK